MSKSHHQKNIEEIDRKVTDTYLKYYRIERCLEFIKQTDKKAAWQQLQNKIEQRKEQQFRNIRIYRRLQYAAACIVIILMSSIGYIWWNNRSIDTGIIVPGNTSAEIFWAYNTQGIWMDDWLNMKVDPNHFNTTTHKHPNTLSADMFTRVIVPTGSEYKICLQDSTWVYLNAESRLEIPTDFSASNRTVSLSGEGYFDVKKDSLHPFQVVTAKAIIEVTGTMFNVRCRDDEPNMNVTLEQGRVSIHSPRGKEIIPVGWKATVGTDQLIELSQADVYKETAWHKGRFVFEDEPLVNIMRELSRWYGIKASFSNDEVRELRFTLDVNRYDTFNYLINTINKMNEINICLKNNEALISQREIPNK